MFLSRNWEKVYSKKYCKICFEVLENYYHWKVFLRETLFKEWSATTIAHRGDNNCNNNTHLFSLLSVDKFKSFLLNYVKYKTNGKRFIVYCWVMDALGRCLGRITKLTTTRGIVKLTSSVCSMGICSTLPLLNLIRWILQLCHSNYYFLILLLHIKLKFRF